MFAVSVNVDDQVMTQIGIIVGAVAGILGSAYSIYRYIRIIAASVRLAWCGLAVSAVMAAGYLGTTWVNKTNFENRVRDYVVAAYKSESPERAKKYMTVALNYLKDTCRHKGSTSILAGAQADDLEEWYADLESTRNDLDTSPIASDSQATLNLDGFKRKLSKFLTFKNDKEGKTTTEPQDLKAPQDIVSAPYNVHFTGWAVGSVALGFGSLCWLGLAYVNRDKVNTQAVLAAENKTLRSDRAALQQQLNQTTQAQALLKTKEQEVENLKNDRQVLGKRLEEATKEREELVKQNNAELTAAVERETLLRNELRILKGSGGSAGNATLSAGKSPF